jgi:diketogulonate reductase-like aldo/keto reductase
MASDPSQPTISLDHAGAMPLVGLGTGAPTGSQCYRAVRYALEVGYRHLESAPSGSATTAPANSTN